jgi:hypothetical protein
LKARFSAIAVCISSWLLAGSAMAAGPFASAGKNPTAQFRSTDRDFLQITNALPSQFLRTRGGGRRGPAIHRDFPASPPTGAMPAMETLMPLSEMTARPPVDYRQTGPFRFNRNGGAVVREISRGYNRMCDSLSGRVWNQPDGKRICFDTRGKPGIAIQIPIN